MIRESLHRRAVPGEGVLDLDRFATTLREMGYDGIVSVEVLSVELRELARRCARRPALYATTASYWI